MIHVRHNIKKAELIKHRTYITNEAKLGMKIKIVGEKE